MINEAIAKITDEMMKAGDEMTRTLEEYLTSICTNEKVAGKILNPDKTLKEFMKSLWDEASKRKVGMKAVITSDEIIPMLEQYYEITEEDKAGYPSRKAAPGKVNPVVDISQFL